MIFTFIDPVVEYVCCILIWCVISQFVLKIIDLWTDFKDHKEADLKLDWVFAFQVILLLTTVFAVVYLVWINPITITISR